MFGVFRALIEEYGPAFGAGVALVVSVRFAFGARSASVKHWLMAGTIVLAGISSIAVEVYSKAVGVDWWPPVEGDWKRLLGEAIGAPFFYFPAIYAGAFLASAILVRGQRTSFIVLWLILAVVLGYVWLWWVLATACSMGAGCV